MVRAKKNPQLTHHEWVSIHNETLSQLTKALNENESLKEKIAVLENEKMALREATENFLESKTTRILLTGDSHLKKISSENLERHTGRKIIKAPAYCSRSDWHGAYYPSSSLVNAVKNNVDDSITHIIMTAPTSDITNVRECDPATRLIFADLSAKSMISTAEWALINYPALQRVYIMEHLPRYILKLFIRFGSFS